MWRLGFGLIQIDRFDGTDRSFTVVCSNGTVAATEANRPPLTASKNVATGFWVDSNRSLRPTDRSFTVVCSNRTVAATEAHRPPLTANR